MGKKSSKVSKEERCFDLSQDDLMVVKLSINGRMTNISQETDETVKVLKNLNEKMRNGKKCFNDLEVEEIVNSLDKSKSEFRIDVQPIRKKFK